jgi:hypothetical protein
MTSAVNYKVFYKSPWGMAFIGYFVAMGLVGALTPPDILTAYSWTRPFTDFMANIVPQIDKVTALGIDADINRFYFSVMWAGSPVLVLMYGLIVLIDCNGRAALLAYYRMPVWKAIKFVFFFTSAAFFSYHVEWFTYAKSRLVLSSFGTSLGRFAAPQVFVIGTVILGLPPLTWLFVSVTDFVNRNTRKQSKQANEHGE